MMLQIYQKRPHFARIRLIHNPLLVYSHSERVPVVVLSLRKDIYPIKILSITWMVATHSQSSSLSTYQTKDLLRRRYAGQNHAPRPGKDAFRP